MAPDRDDGVGPGGEPTAPRPPIPVSPSLEPALASTGSAARAPASRAEPRLLRLSVLAAGVALAAALVAQLLTRLIGLVTNLAYYQRLSVSFVSPAGNRLGLGAVAVPVVGGALVGLMARYGSRAIRGHGIPEAMEQVLTNQSRIPARITFLKPLSAAIAIGTGGPFGAEGPIIATGGALGSLLGQLLSTTASEKKTLLAAGAAAGMTATFGSPVSAVLLAVELLLFEYRARSLVPVAFACSVAAAVRGAIAGSAPVFPMPAVAPPTPGAIAAYLAVGVIAGLAAVAVTRLVYAIEDGFERLPIHWMWWPALGGVVVGVVGLVAPRTLGVGYDNIEHLVDGELVGSALVALCAWKLVSWAIALGSGTSGGTLAPLFTIGGGIGGVTGAALAAALPALGVDVRVAALVGMAALFAGASRALLASIVFAFETTREPAALLPLLAGGTAAYVVSLRLMRHTIMTEKIARRGVRVASEYGADPLAQIAVAAFATRPARTVRADESIASLRERLAPDGDSTHQAFPVEDVAGRLVGVITRRDLAGAGDGARVADLIRRAPVTIRADDSLREAADRMARERVGRLPVVERDAPDRVVGILTRSDLVAALLVRIEGDERAERHLALGRRREPR